MINLLEMITIKWTTRNKTYYEQKGYQYTKLGDEFQVYLKDLPQNSAEKVPVVCDCPDCSNRNTVTPLRNYNKIIKNNGIYRCKNCAFKESMHIRDNKSKQRLFQLFLQKCNEHDCIPITTFDNFTGCDCYMEYICPIHGKTSTLMSRISNENAWCYKCGKIHMAEKQRLSPEKVKELIESKNNNLLLNPDDYINATTKNLQVVCGTCHTVFTTSYSSVYNSDGRCSKCGQLIGGNLNRTTKEELIELATIDGVCMVLNPDNYVDMYTPLLFTCVECGNSFSSKPHNYVKRGFCRCENCQLYSKGEETIASFLDNNKITYVRQMKFKECIDKRMLPFDFYIPQHNLLIEYNGKQHYCPIDYFGGIENFEQQKKHDQIKTEFAKQNNITLLTIPYTEFDNIETILNIQLFKQSE